MKKRKRVKIITAVILFCGAAVCVAAALYRLWWYGAFLPGWVRWQEREAVFAGHPVELVQRKVTLYDGGDRKQALFQTEDDRFVQDMIVTDIDDDGSEDLILLIWKHGSYGAHRPFWEKENDKELRQHIFIYREDDTGEELLRPQWMSSQVEHEIEGISAEEDGSLRISYRDGSERSWVWEGFGLKLAGQ